MKLNNKGFTMIELIAVVTIIAILALIAVPSVAPYINKARKTSMNTMLKSTYEAAENYMIKNDIVLDLGVDKTFMVKNLIEDGYLQSLVDPLGDSEKNCEDDENSKVIVKRVNDSLGGLANYTYKVTLVCPLSGTKIYTYGDNDLENVYLEGKRFYENENVTRAQFFLREMIDKGYLSNLQSKLQTEGCLTTSRVKREKIENRYKYTVKIDCGVNSREGEYLE